MESGYLSPTLTELGPGDHLCSLYETEEEHRALLTPFLRQGLDRGEKVIYLAHAHTGEIVQGYLRDDGMVVEPYLASGQLSILAVDDVYMRAGVFDPDGAIAFLRTETERAMGEGYTALRVTGEMSCVPRLLSGPQRLIEYEARLNEFFPAGKCLAICQYDRRIFDPAVLLDVLCAHPTCVVGTAVCDNFYYMPPTESRGHDASAAKLCR
ncbi:MAG: MEDS domain-containing protein [Desulfobacterales bacterium]|nr:MEDS domain-containing protein [Desulfobacterales bacterium]